MLLDVSTATQLISFLYVLYRLFWCYMLTVDPCSPETRPLQLTGSGSLTSANYPSNYNDNADCQWLLVSSDADWASHTVHYYTLPLDLTVRYNFLRHHVNSTI